MPETRCGISPPGTAGGANRKMKMLTVRQASETDCPLIRCLADEAFPATYRELHHSRAAGLYDGVDVLCGEPAGAVPRGPRLVHRLVRRCAVRLCLRRTGRAKTFSTCRKSMSCPGFRASAPGRSCSAGPWSISGACIPRPARMELNVNRRNPRRAFLRTHGHAPLREGDFPIGNGYYMNDYIMGMEIK